MGFLVCSVVADQFTLGQLMSTLGVTYGIDKNAKVGLETGIFTAIFVVPSVLPQPSH